MKLGEAESELGWASGLRQKEGRNKEEKEVERERQPERKTERQNEREVERAASDGRVGRCVALRLLILEAVGASVKNARTHTRTHARSLGKDHWTKHRAPAVR